MSLSRRTFLQNAVALSALSSLPFSLVDDRALAQEAELAPKFQLAKPVWGQGREDEMNVTLVFSANVKLASAAQAANAIFRATGSSIMRVTINGEEACYGPARGPRGWFRVDEWNVGAYLHEGVNRVVVEIAGYNSVSYYLLSQPAFLRAELVDADGRVLAATSVDELDNVARFTAVDYTGVRVQKVQRQGYHRTFIEAYDFRKLGAVKPVELALQPEHALLPRRCAYPELNILPVACWGKTGKLELREDYKPWRGQPITGINSNFTGYREDELELFLIDEIQQYRTRFDAHAEPLSFGATYTQGDVQIVDFGADYAGFWGFEVKALEECEFAISFDEVLTEHGDVNFMRFSTCNAVKWTLPKSDDAFKFETFDPQAARYIKIHCLKGSFKLVDCYMREYAYPQLREAAFDCADPRIAKVFQAAALTFRCNAVDVFSDCPTRERAGWMCDSFFTARAAFALTGKTDVESATYENYRLPKSYPNIPDGALPMCYPSDTWHGQFIPNWMMWFVVELKEYAQRSGDNQTLELLREKVEKLVKFFAQYENSDGLLEKLPNRVFVEWSKANDFLQDVNYPTNMLYAAALDAAGELYARSEWRQKAQAMRKTIRNQAYDGEFFVDHAVRKEDGSLEVLTDKSEVCQYFAFFFKTATPETFPELWEKLLDEFGPDRVKNGLYPEVHKANSFVGNVVRMELLSSAKRADQILRESLAYNEYMADLTGTLWENATASASCNHGFASHIAYVFYRDVLGIREIDPLAKKVVIAAPKIDSISWCAGARPVPGGVVRARWERDEQTGGIAMKCDTPDGYTVVMED